MSTKEQVTTEEEIQNFRGQLAILPYASNTGRLPKESRDYMLGFRNRVFAAVEADAMGETLPPATDRLELFSIEEMGQLSNLFGLRELEAGAVELSDRKDSVELGCINESPPTEKYQELADRLLLSYMNVQPPNAELRLIGIRSSDECVLGVLTPEEIGSFVNEYNSVSRIPETRDS